MSRFSVWPVLPTPFHDDGSIDREAFASVAAFALEAGVDGVVYPGVASEVDRLSEEECTVLVRDLGRHLGGRIPFVVGASAADPAVAGRHAEIGREVGAVSAMVRAPAKAGSEAAGQIAYFGAVSAGTSLPIMLQNVPSANGGAGLSPDTVAAIARAVPAVRFVKEETLPCGQNVARIRGATEGLVEAVYGGAGARYVLEEIGRGAAGTMPALELADIHVALAAAINAGNEQLARELYRDSLPFLNYQAVFRWHATKHALALRGVLRGRHVRMPGPVPDAEDCAEAERLLSGLASRFATRKPQPRIAA